MIFFKKLRYWWTFNPIKPDPFEFLIRLRVCLRDTPSLTTIWNELEGWNFACRFDFTFHEDSSIQILKIDPFRVGGGVITLYKSPKCPQWGSMSSPDFYRVKITKSKLVGLHHGQIQSHMQKISVLAQYLTKFGHFWLKIEVDQICSKCDFSKILSRYQKFDCFRGDKRVQLEKSWNDSPFTSFI